MPVLPNNSVLAALSNKKHAQTPRASSLTYCHNYMKVDHHELSDYGLLDATPIANKRMCTNIC